ncbi:hypothetical protein VTK56DRAFT_5121 [Thermocarpiscus australiensis]
MERDGRETGGEDGHPAGERWATDVLIRANNSWLVGIPEGLERGAYVLRHEIVALHYAAREGGAQNYPLCANIWVEEAAEGNKTAAPFTMDGYDAREMYRLDDPGILVNISAAMTSYAVPGPTVAAGAKPVPYSEQRGSVLTAGGTPVVVTRRTETLLFDAIVTPTAAMKVGRRYRRRV